METFKYKDASGKLVTATVSETQIKNALYVVEYLTKTFGLSITAACGAVGNGFAESSWNPSSWNPNDGGSPSGGFFQWHAGRLTALKNLASQKDTTWSDLQIQCEYFAQEYAGAFIPSSKKGEFEKASTIEEAADIFMTNWERPSGRSTLDKRQKAGAFIYEMYTGKKYDISDYTYTTIDDKSVSLGNSSYSIADDIEHLKTVHSEDTFNSDIIQFKTENVALKMFDRLVKADDDRRKSPLRYDENVLYIHRAYSDDGEYSLIIGDCWFTIPPEFISVVTESSTQKIITLRQENSTKAKSGYSRRTITIDLVLNGMNQINGYKVKGPDKTYYVDGLRALLAQFKCTPFLPIYNTTINTVYGINVVALQSIVCSTVPNYPNLLEVNLVLQEADLFPYIDNCNVMLTDMIDWDLFRWYYQRQLTEGENYLDKKVYGKLKNLPLDKEHNKFKISVLNDACLEGVDYEATADGAKSFYNIIFDRYIRTVDYNGLPDGNHVSNFVPFVDSDTMQFTIHDFKAGYANILTNIQLAELDNPTIQYMGGMDTNFSIILETKDKNVINKFEELNQKNNQFVKDNRAYNGLGFVKLECELVQLFGSLFVMIDSITTATVPGFPGLFTVQINCISFDAYQKENEGINGHTPFFVSDKDNVDVWISNPGTSYASHEHIGGYSDSLHEKDGAGKKQDVLSQDLAGLYNKISQDLTVEEKMRMYCELYPDLKLPTYKEVDEQIAKIIQFRQDNGLKEYPLKAYPRNPINSISGVGRTVDYKNMTLEESEEYIHTNQRVPLLTGVIKDIYNVYSKHFSREFNGEGIPIIPLSYKMIQEVINDTQENSIFRLLGNLTDKGCLRSSDGHPFANEEVFSKNGYKGLFVNEDTQTITFYDKSAWDRFLMNLFNFTPDKDKDWRWIDESFTKAAYEIYFKCKNNNITVDELRTIINNETYYKLNGENLEPIVVQGETPNMDSIKGKTLVELDTDGFCSNYEELLNLMPRYEVYVDPDFYVFYPDTYETLVTESKKVLGENFEYTGYKIDEQVQEIKQKLALSKFRPNTPDINMKISDNDSVNDFLNIAMNKLGKCVYVWGASGAVSEGVYQFDCSGFVGWCLTQAGIAQNSGHWLTTQWLIYGSSPSTWLFLKHKVNAKTNSGAELLAYCEPGDLVAFNDGKGNKGSGHVGIYIGEGNYIHCTGNKGVIISKLNTSSFTHIFGITKFYEKAATTITNSSSSNAEEDTNIKRTTSEIMSVSEYSKKQNIDESELSSQTFIDVSNPNVNCWCLTQTQTEHIVASVYYASANEDEMAYVAQLYYDMLSEDEYGWHEKIIDDIDKKLKLKKVDVEKAQKKKKFQTAYQIVIDVFTKKAKATPEKIIEITSLEDYAYNGHRIRNARTGLYMNTDKNNLSKDIVWELYSHDNTLIGVSNGEVTVTTTNITKKQEIDAEQIVKKFGRPLLCYTSEMMQDNNGLITKFAQWLNDDEQFIYSFYSNITDETYTLKLKETITTDKAIISVNGSKDDPEVKMYVKVGEHAGESFVINNSEIYVSSIGQVQEKRYGTYTVQTIDKSKMTASQKEEFESLKEEYMLTMDEDDAIDLAYQDIFGVAGMSGDSKTIKLAQNNYNSAVNMLTGAFCNDVEYASKGRLMRAFPTYFVSIIDENGQWYNGAKLWANYYFLRSLVEIQVNEFDDSPAHTAIIVVTDSYNNLSQRTKGSEYYSLSGKVSTDMLFGVIPINRVGPDSDNEYAMWQRNMYANFGLLPGLGLKVTQKMVDCKNIIYKSMVLKAGSRMHIRMGYGSDPLGLATVFNGHISDVSVGNVLTITGMSDGVELVNSVVSSKQKEKNSVFHEEASNMHMALLERRVNNFANSLFPHSYSFCPSKYGIEHFGLYFNYYKELYNNNYITSVYNGANWFQIGLHELGQTISEAEQGLMKKAQRIHSKIWGKWRYIHYDMFKNIYRASYNGSLAMYSSLDGFKDNEENLRCLIYNKTPWDCFQIMCQSVPEYVSFPMYHQFESRHFFGLPYWMTKYRYNVIDNLLFEEARPFAQAHYIDGLQDIIDNQMKCSGRDLATNVIVMYQQGKSAYSTPTIYSDRSIDYAKQSTKIYDSSTCGSFWVSEKLQSLFSVEGSNAKLRACDIGISQLLINWARTYRGEIYLLGNAGINVYDYIYLNDRYNDITGLCTVRRVTHSLSVSTGFCTTIVPGLIGTSTKSRSNAPVVIGNLSNLCSCFAYAMEYKKNIRIVQKYYTPYLLTTSSIKLSAMALYGIGNTVGFAAEGFYIATNIGKALKNAKAAYDASKVVATYLKTAKEAQGLFKTAKNAFLAFKGSEKGIEFLASAATDEIVLAAAEATAAEAVAAESASLTAAGISELTAAGGTAIAGLAGVELFVVSLAVIVATHIIFNKMFQYMYNWFEYRNTIKLIPMLRKGTPYCCRDGFSLILGAENIEFVENYQPALTDKEATGEGNEDGSGKDIIDWTEEEGGTMQTDKKVLNKVVDYDTYNNYTAHNSSHNYDEE